MSYSDLGALMPSATQQGENYLDAARAEATRRAAYLSSMDQFYAELEAKDSWFDRDLAFRERTLEYQDRWETTRDENIDEDRAANKWIAQLNADTSIDVAEIGAESRLDIAELGYEYQDKWHGEQMSFERDRFEWEQDESDWIKDMYEREQGSSYIEQWSQRTGLNPEWYNLATSSRVGPSGLLF